MKRIGFFLLAVILLTVLVGGVSCQSKTAQYSTTTPDGTVKLYFDAWSELNPEKLAQLYVEDKRSEIQTVLKRAFEGTYSVSIKRLEIEIISQTDNTAKVIARFDTVLTKYKPILDVENEEAVVPGQMYQVKGYDKNRTEKPKRFEDQVAEFDLVKQDGEWLIKETTLTQ